MINTIEIFGYDEDRKLYVTAEARTVNDTLKIFRAISLLDEVKDIYIFYRHKPTEGEINAMDKIFEENGYEVTRKSHLNEIEVPKHENT